MCVCVSEVDDPYLLSQVEGYNRVVLRMQDKNRARYVVHTAVERERERESITSKSVSLDTVQEMLLVT